MMCRCSYCHSFLRELCFSCTVNVGGACGYEQGVPSGSGPTYLGFMHAQRQKWYFEFFQSASECNAFHAHALQTSERCGMLSHDWLVLSKQAPCLHHEHSPLRFLRRNCECPARIKCVNSQYCKGTSIVVPIVDLCPGGNWCCPTCTHFDLSQAAFNAIAEPIAGHVPLQYTR